MSQNGNLSKYIVGVKIFETTTYYFFETITWINIEPENDSLEDDFPSGV